MRPTASASCRSRQALIDGKAASVVHLDANNDVTVFGALTLKASDFWFV